MFLCTHWLSCSVSGIGGEEIELLQIKGSRQQQQTRQSKLVG
jgi:hypothetical protein